MFGTLGVPEIAVIFILALVLFGPKKLPELGRTIGKAMTEFRRASNDLKATFEREMNILDVWFDSGSTHAFTLEGNADLKWPADLYLEGSDQHRGWFHSSLLESCGTRGRAPYDGVLTHGFTLDEQGRKMSKSLGNTTDPAKVIASSGADILRLWVCATDYADDQRIGPEILKNVVETYRKLRNSIRWMLGTLHHYKRDDAVAFADMPELERLMLHQLAGQSAIVREAYASFDYKTVIASLANFMNTELSAFYFDVRKDTLYCEPPSSLTRKAALTAIDIICDAILKWLAPALSFTAEEIYLNIPGQTGESVHLETWYAFPAVAEDKVRFPGPDVTDVAVQWMASCCPESTIRPVAPVTVDRVMAATAPATRARLTPAPPHPNPSSPNPPKKS